MTEIEKAFAAIGDALKWADRATEQGIACRVLTGNASMHAGHIFTLANAVRANADNPTPDAVTALRAAEILQLTLQRADHEQKEWLVSGIRDALAALTKT